MTHEIELPDGVRGEYFLTKELMDSVQDAEGDVERLIGDKAKHFGVSLKMNVFAESDKGLLFTWVPVPPIEEMAA